MVLHRANSKVFMAFSDVTRLKILELLRFGERSATFLRSAVNAGQSTLSHHMKILIESGIVSSRKEGKWTFYAISESGGRHAVKLLRHLSSITKFGKTESDTPVEAITPTAASLANAELQAGDEHRPENKAEKQPENTKTQRSPKNVKPFTIFVDTSCDLSPEFIEEHSIEVLPIPFVLNNVEHADGYWQKTSGKDFYNALKNGGSAKTSSINPYTFIDSFTECAKQDIDAIYIILSSNLSATYQNAQIALMDVKELYPDCNVFIIDSISATAANTLITMLAVEKRSEGFSAQETAEWLEEKKNHLFGVFTVDDLMYLQRGGRLGMLSAIGGSLLGIKPILNLQPDGSLKLKDKVRGREAALNQLVNQLEISVTPHAAIDKLLITHTDCVEDAQKLADMVKAKYDVRQLEIMLMGPVIGAHVGPRTVALVYESEMTRENFENMHYYED